MEVTRVKTEDGEWRRPPPPGQRWYQVFMSGGVLDHLTIGGKPLSAGPMIYFCAPVDEDPAELTSKFQEEVKSPGVKVTVEPLSIIEVVRA